VTDFSDYFEQQIANWFRGTSVVAALANLHWALYTVAPSDSGGGTEVTGGSYARLQIASSTGEWSAPGVDGTITNNNDWIWPTATANWGTIVALAGLSAAAGGNQIIWKLLELPVTIATTEIFRLNAGKVSIRVA
jgi:hypothetical protein